MMQSRERTRVSARKGDVELESAEGSEVDGLVDKTAMLLRAAQPMSVQFEKLPDSAKTKLMKASESMQSFLETASLLQEEMIDAYQSLPEEDQQIVLTQLGQNPFDGTTQPKEGPKTRRYTTTEDGVRTKVTETRNGAYFHQTKHNKFGTETTTQGKGGYEHSHKYKHNGYGGQAKTETSSTKGSWEHGHSHEHNYNQATGQTRTSTRTVSKGKGILDLTHEHDHTHRNVAGVGTQSYTRTRTDSDIGTHTHEHEHYHNDQTGDYDSEARSKSNGPKWGEIFSSDED